MWLNQLSYPETTAACSHSVVPAPFNLKSVSKEAIRIDRVATCAHEHVSCSFSAEYFGLVNLGFVSVLQGYTTQDALSRWGSVDYVWHDASSPSHKRRWKSP